MAIKGLTKDGQLVDADQPGVAYVVDPDEPGAKEFIESVRNKAKSEGREVPSDDASDTGAQTTLSAGAVADDQAGGLVTVATHGAGEGVPDSALLTEDERRLVDEFGERVAQEMFKAGFRSREALEQADDPTLIGIKGVGPGLLKKIRGEEE